MVRARSPFVATAATASSAVRLARGPAIDGPHDISVSAPATGGTAAARQAAIGQHFYKVVDPMVGQPGGMGWGNKNGQNRKQHGSTGCGDCDGVRTHGCSHRRVWITLAGSSDPVSLGGREERIHRMVSVHELLCMLQCIAESELNVGQSDRKRGGLADNVDIGDGRRSAHGFTNCSVAVRASVLRANFSSIPRLFALTGPVPGTVTLKLW